jgi:hypothetical protein
MTDWLVTQIPFHVGVSGFTMAGYQTPFKGGGSCSEGAFVTELSFRISVVRTLYVYRKFIGTLYFKFAAV